MADEVRQKTSCGQEKQKWNQQFVGFSLQETDKSLILLKEQPRKDEVQGHSERPGLNGQRIVHPQHRCDVSKHNKGDADAFSEIYPLYPLFCHKNSSIKTLQLPISGTGS